MIRQAIPGRSPRLMTVLLGHRDPPCSLLSSGTTGEAVQTVLHES